MILLHTLQLLQCFIKFECVCLVFHNMHLITQMLTTCMITFPYSVFRPFICLIRILLWETTNLHCATVELLLPFPCHSTLNIFFMREKRVSVIHTTFPVLLVVYLMTSNISFLKRTHNHYRQIVMVAPHCLLLALSSSRDRTPVSTTDAATY